MHDGEEGRLYRRREDSGVGAREDDVDGECECECCSLRGEEREAERGLVWMGHEAGVARARIDWRA